MMGGDSITTGSKRKWSVKSSAAGYSEGYLEVTHYEHSGVVVVTVGGNSIDGKPIRVGILCMNKKDLLAASKMLKDVAGSML